MAKRLLLLPGIGADSACERPSTAACSPTCSFTHRRHIHGDDDRIIPIRRVTPDAIVKGAGHLLNVTHPAIVNAFIDAAMSARTPGGLAAANVHP